MKNYHCCATCRHFRVMRTGPQTNVAKCTRLGFETKSNYQFNCWAPRPDIALKMKQQTQDVRPSENSHD